MSVERVSVMDENPVVVPGGMGLSSTSSRASALLQPVLKAAARALQGSVAAPPSHASACAPVDAGAASRDNQACAEAGAALGSPSEDAAAGISSASASGSTATTVAVAAGGGGGGAAATAASVQGGAASAADSKTGARNVPVGVWIVLSVFSSTSLILTNKFIMKTYNFSYIYTLTSFHFAAGAIFLNVVSRGFGAFKPKSIGIRENIMVAASAVGSVASMNLSLQYNSVGTYQMMKLMVIPTVMGIQRVVHGATFPLPVMLSLMVMLVGVACATVTDVSFNLLGVCVGLVAVCTTALFAIWQGSKQKQHDVTAQQLLLSISPYQAGLAGICSLLFDFSGPKSIQTHNFYQEEIILIVTSCFIAVLVNLCSMNLIGATSPVTYNVVGHAKTCLILASGYFLVPGPVESIVQMFQHFAGVIVGLLGVFSYSYFKITLVSVGGGKGVGGVGVLAGFAAWSRRCVCVWLQAARDTKTSNSK